MSSSDQMAVLSNAERNKLESFLLEFEDSWRPDMLGDYVQRVENEVDQKLKNLTTSELVKIDLHRSWQADCGKPLEDYSRELGISEHFLPELILAEYLARKSVNPNLDLNSYEARFPKQFPQVLALASQHQDSQVGFGKSDNQASIQTSRVGNAKETTTKQPVKKSELPQEFGRYRILRVLGSGAMGMVYLAHDTQLDRQVALKTPSFKDGQDDDLVVRFEQEARSAAKIH